MKRREFLRSAVLTGVGSVAAAQLARAGIAGQAAGDAADEAVRRVLVVFKCHLDVGFTDTQANVMTTYFTKYYPLAIETAARRRQEGKSRYVWTTGSWLLYEYLEQASGEDRRRMEEAVGSGDIAWHALPFSWQTEMLDRSTIEGCLGFASALDARFGRKTIAGKMTDVPGHSRGLVAPLAAGGIRLLDIGVNSASTPLEVPDLFLWKEPGGASIAVLYHRHDYGSVVRVPGSDLAVAVEVRTDNSGPHTPEEIDQMHAKLQRQFPRAQVSAATLSEVATAMEPARAALPVVTGEIGDTWIYGAASDPPKIARYREMARLRGEWLASKRFQTGDATDRQLLRRLVLAVEHTWGTDTKRYIDHEHYAPKDLALYLDKPNYQVMERSWQEKRDDIDAGVRNLPGSLRTEAEERLRRLRVTAPNSIGMHAVDAKKAIRTAHFELAFDAKTGCLHGFRNSRTGHAWASPEHPLALFSYQTLSQADYTAFLAAYVRSKESWAPQDFGKPNIDSLQAESRSWQPALRHLWMEETPDRHRLLAELGIDDAASRQRGLVAWPETMYLELILPKAEAVAQLTFYALGKTANRMPEAMWLSFVPQMESGATWRLDKVNEAIDPMDVVRGGGRRMHAVTNAVTCRAGKTRLEIATLDAPVVAFAAMSPLNFSEDPPEVQRGVHVSLFNNAWGTNYPQWASGDWRYRFVLKG